MSRQEDFDKNTFRYCNDDVVSDLTRRLDRFTQNQLELIKKYVIENMI